MSGQKNVRLPVQFGRLLPWDTRHHQAPSRIISYNYPQTLEINRADEQLFRDG